MSDVELAMAEYRRKAGWDGHPEAIEAVWSLAYRSGREDASAAVVKHWDDAQSGPDHAAESARRRDPS